MTFKTNLLPGTDNTWELGSSSLGWKITKINIPTASTGTITYGPGTSGQVLRAAGGTDNRIYWGTISKSDVGLSNVENTKLSTWTGSSNITTIGTLSSGTVPWARLSGVPTTFTPSTHTHYWANIATTSAAAYNKAPEMATLKLNGNTSATAASTSNVTLVYDTTSQALNFVFA